MPDRQKALDAAKRYIDGEDIPWIDFHGHVSELLKPVDIEALTKEVLGEYALQTVGDYIEDSVEMALFDFCIKTLREKGHI